MAPGQPPLGSPSGGRTPGPGTRGQGLSTGAPRMRPGGSGGGFHPGEELCGGQEQSVGGGPDSVLGAESATPLSPVQP